MSRIHCFFLTPVEQSDVIFRRYRSSDYGKADIACPGKMGYCTTTVVVERVSVGNNSYRKPDDEKKADPRWPKKCEDCGYEYQPEDHWQWGERQLYERSDTKELVALQEAPVGAMWNADWLKGSHRIKDRPDGLVLTVRTPDGDWVIDGGSSNGNGWERTGEPPMITASPSIICGSYHGWLRNGVLEEC